MHILLIRHGTREREGGKDAVLRLNDVGRTEAAKLKDELKLLNFEGDVWLSSKHVHSVQTAKILSDEKTVYGLDALTPRSPTETLNQIIDELETMAVNLKGAEKIAIVGHWPRLGQLFTRLTSEKIGPMECCGAICVEGSWIDLLRGNGKTAFRTPVLVPDIEVLMDKVHRKMEVSVFLAAFTIPALIEVVKDAKAEMELGRAISAIALTLSLALYVAAVYLYDELAMPEEFWKGRPGSKNRKFAELIRTNGPIYAYMTRGWTWIFTPAVFFTAIGFLILFWQAWLEEIKWPSWVVGCFCIVAIALAAVLFLVLRPKAAKD
jgi:phosphohistidine phosphatase SixA